MGEIKKQLSSSGVFHCFEAEFKKKPIILAKKLPVSESAQEKIIRILSRQEPRVTDDWQLYGKAGSGFLFDEQGVRNQDQKIG
ncbi:hypothetical protein BCY86_00275 [Pajaroellobacter abortibovis]|uniref:Uncharacterized protein n=2 Tax=Pajaroellobacter abortibovis TaxID=1882918 RepID=A0A1L6MUX5_9BACT|nr:hypothetical protein BCY86_00275 [Pajaroellobacter abortibovis]